MVHGRHRLFIKIEKVLKSTFIGNALLRGQSRVEAVELARRAAEAGGLHIIRRAQIGDRAWDFTPLAHLRVGMTVLVENSDGYLVPTRVDEVDTASRHA